MANYSPWRAVAFGAIASTLVATSALAQPGAELSPLAERITAALATDVRTDAERERDANRKPVETLEFFGLEPGMRVLELIPGGGWYTKIL
ncbi:MAG: hypothetical protein AAFX85_20520, partial [Pseudomonadota bacterium]